MKKISILILIVTCITFCIWQIAQNQSYEVLEVISINKIVLDLNHNNIKDHNETVELPINLLELPLLEGKTDAAKKGNLNSLESKKIEFLAHKFAQKLLLGQKVKFINNNIYLNNKNYKEILIENGFIRQAAQKQNDKFSQNIKSAQKLNLVIFNNKSHKYHTLDCKYGKLAHNFQIIEQKQLPKDAKPCKFCHSRHHKTNAFEKIKQLPNQNVKSASTHLKISNIEIFITDYTNKFRPDDQCLTRVCQALLNEINNTKETIDFAIYGYTKSPVIENALINAQQRGVKIRFVYDLSEKKDNIYPNTLYLSSIFKCNTHDMSPAIMHNKFFIFDHKKTIAGSANLSNTDMSGFNSNVIVAIDSEQIANYYTQEFDQMLCGLFHKRKHKITNKEPVNTPDSTINVFFSPKEKIIETQIIPLIENAQKYIYMPTFLITHEALSQSLIDARKRGVDVKIIIDATNAHSCATKHKELRKNSIPVKTEIFTGKLHSKSLIIDDKYTVIGSMNFSKSGEDANDENTIIIKNSQIAIFYKHFFEYLWGKIPDFWLTHDARAESQESIGSCQDGLDNDFDGKIDSADDSCKIVNKKSFR